MDSSIKKEVISQIFNRRISKTLPILGFRNESYKIECDNKNYFLKFGKDYLIEKEAFILEFFQEYSSFNSPILFSKGKGYLITIFEENLSEYNPEEVSKVINSFHTESLDRDYSTILNRKDIIDFFSRKRISNKFRENYSTLKRFKVKKIENILAAVREEEYLKLPHILCHGDSYRRNILKDSFGNPFFLDFEFSHINSPTFDISTNLYSDPDYLEKSLISYLDASKHDKLKIYSQNYLANLILADTVRICLNDIIKSMERIKEKSKLEKRLKHCTKVLEKII